jgi:hypothetical protein
VKSRDALVAKLEYVAEAPTCADGLNLEAVCPKRPANLRQNIVNGPLTLGGSMPLDF